MRDEKVRNAEVSVLVSVEIVTRVFFFLDGMFRIVKRCAQLLVAANVCSKIEILQVCMASLALKNVFTNGPAYRRRLSAGSQTCRLI